MLKKSLRYGCGIAVLSLSFLVAGAFGAVAAEPVLLKESGDWSAYVLSEGGQKICYMVSSPVKMEGKYGSRGNVYVMITHNVTENTRDTFSFISGYTYKDKSSVTASVDGKSFDLFTQADTAWTPDASVDIEIVKSLKKGSKLVIEGASARGNATKDTFSLKGSGEAYKEISKACDLM